MSQNLYKLYCIDEKKVVEEWRSTPPTVCPNNMVHNIELDSIKISKQYNNSIIATEDTTGNFETEHITMIIPSGTPGDITEHDVSWPMDILLWKTLLTPTTAMIGDLISVLAAPETQVGAITSAVNIGDTVLNVDSGIFNYIKRGYLITLDDTTNKDVLDRITAIDSIAGTITVQTPTSFAYNPGTPVKISIYVLKNIYIDNTNTISIGGKGLKGKKVPAGIILRVYYTNNSGTTKTFRWRSEIYNDG